MFNLFVLFINIIFAAVYLEAVEYNRYICLALWVVVPLTNIILLGIKEYVRKF